MDVPKKVVEGEMGHGTISRLGLIIKQKPEGVKRRIILDLRRSGGNRKAQLPEKLVLPRPRDAVAMIRDNYNQRRSHQANEGYSRELVVIDISDAFMSLAVKECELPHTLAPEVQSDDFVLFCALLFGYKTAPLLWSRLACMARFLQALFQGGEAQHQVYLDDGLWVLQGTLKERNSMLALILTTICGLGFKVSLKKGLRSTQVEWVGVRFTITEDSVILALPDQFVKDLMELLTSWENKGMAPTKELRQAAGKLSWLSGILPRARWTAAVFYRVLHERLNAVASGLEDSRRAVRDDAHNKDGLFIVKQLGLEQARSWLVKFLGVALEAPVKKFKLDIAKYPKATIMMDASPLGVGAVLLVNGRIVKGYASKVTHRDARLLQFEDHWELSSSQGIVETFSVLLALKQWAKELSSCHVELQVQSDSIVALATLHKLASGDPMREDWYRRFKVQPHYDIPSAANVVALQYIRKGWAVSQVGYLGRWKSNVILEYAQEALESLAVNASNHFKGSPTEAKAVTKAPSLADMLALGKQLDGKVDKELVNRLQTELDALRQDSEGANSALSEAIKNMEGKMDTSTKYLPPLVQSARHQVVHRNNKTLVFSPSATWKTACGWYYYLANYQFAEGDPSMITCAKCLGSAHSKEVDKADK